MNATHPLSADGIASPPGALKRHVDAVGDDAGMAVLRRRALALADGTDWSRCSDQQVVSALAAAAGDDQAPPPRLSRLAIVAKAAAAAPAPAPASRPRPAAAPAAAVEEAAFPAHLDVAATVRALVEAARSGVPFCEECARAAAAGQS